MQRSLLGINLGVTDCRLTPFPKSGKVARIRLLAKTAEAKQELESGMMEKHLLKTCKGLLGIEKKTDDTLDLRFMPKGTPGRPPKTERPAKVAEKTTVKKMSGRKKQAKTRKRSVKRAGPKRTSKLRLPRNSSKKPHVVTLFKFLNSCFNDAERADCLNALAKHVPKSPLIQFTKRSIFTKQARAKLVKKIVKLMTE